MIVCLKKHKHTILEMSVNTTSNDQEIEGEEVCIGNDGCPVILDHSPITPATPRESPSTPSGKSKSKSFVQSIKGAFYDEFHFEETPEYANSLKRMIIDGSDILSLTPTDINNMSLEKVNSLLAQLHIEGNLRKKGFRGFQMWKRRYFEVIGDTMMYFEVFLFHLFLYRLEIGKHQENVVKSRWMEK